MIMNAHKITFLAREINWSLSFMIMGGSRDISTEFSPGNLTPLELQAIIFALLKLWKVT